MSVHGEYNRSLEALLISVRRLRDETLGGEWADALEAARSGRHADLSTAATACLDALESMDAASELSSPTGASSEVDSLREPYQHLMAHCRSILGVSSPTHDY